MRTEGVCLKLINGVFAPWRMQGRGGGEVCRGRELGQGRLVHWGCY